MFTIKQMEAIYWVGSLGSFEAAASYLNVAQSTISKRIGELEGRFNAPLFDRTARQSVLTSKGQGIMEIAEQILRLNDKLTANARAIDAPPLRFRLGATDLVAMSWLPELLARIIDLHPEVEIEPEIDLSTELINRLIERQIDFAIVPRVTQHAQFVNQPLGEIELVWLASPALLKGRTALTQNELLAFPLLTQSAKSILRPVLHSVTDNDDLSFAKKILCNNMGALAELAAFGLGITILPKAFFARYISEGRLVIVTTPIALPKLEYFITYRNDYHRRFFAEVADLCRAICDFRSKTAG